MSKHALGASVILAIVLSASANQAGNKQEFMAYCSTSQSDEFCQCASDAKFDTLYNAEIDRRKKVMETSRQYITQALQWALNSDAAMNETNLQHYCPIKYAYQSDIEAYALDKFGSKTILRRTLEVNAEIETIRQIHVTRMDALHDEFGANEITRQNFNAMKIPYCTALAQFNNNKEAYERAGDPDFEMRVNVPFDTVIRSAIKDHRSGCREFYQR